MQRRKERQPEGNTLLGFPAGVRCWKAPRLAPRTSHYFRRANLSPPEAKGSSQSCTTPVLHSWEVPALWLHPQPLQPRHPLHVAPGEGTCRSVFPRRDVWDKSGGRASSCPGSLLTHRHIPHSVPLWNPNLPLLESPMALAAGRSLSPPPWGRVVPLAQDRPPRGAGREGVAQGTSCLARCCP